MPSPSSHLPTLAIVGRPNVGKSALFNCILKQRLAIVDEAEGITRDRLYAEADLFGFPFRIIDTGGVDQGSKAPYQEAIRRQCEIAVQEADVIIMVVDGRTGVTHVDQQVASWLHQSGKPLTLAVNKIDNPDDDHLQYGFRKLGIERMVSVSATQAYHLAELLETAFQGYQAKEYAAPAPSPVKVAIVGRPNVGKSSLLNFILQEDRCIVSPMPGTTRDSIDVTFSLPSGEQITLIDTAGIRRKSGEHEVVDKFAAIRTEKAIERADICLLMADAERGLTTRDKKIANTIEENGKGCILLFNKWDLVKGFRMEHCLKDIEDEAPFLNHCPTLCISAKTGRNVDQIFPLIQEVKENSEKRIGTGELNSFIAAALQRNHPPMMGGKRLRIYYMTQVDIKPPQFATFVNYPNLMAESYKKYLYNQFRQAFKFTGMPIRFYLKGKKREPKQE